MNRKSLSRLDEGQPQVARRRTMQEPRVWLTLRAGRPETPPPKLATISAFPKKGREPRLGDAAARWHRLIDLKLTR
jgi:hypothetical protein